MDEEQSGTSTTTTSTCPGFAPIETIPALVYQIPVPPSCMEPVGFARWTCPSDHDRITVGTRSSVLQVFKIESRKGTDVYHFFADNFSQTLQCNNTLVSFQLLCFLLSAVLLYLVCLINFHGILLITLHCTALHCSILQCSAVQCSVISSIP